MDFTPYIETAIEYLGIWSFLLIILFGILHPTVEQPWSFVATSYALLLYGVIGLLILFVSNMVGVLILYVICHTIKVKNEDIIQNKKILHKSIKWLEKTETYKHIIAIGIPLVPTWIIKVAIGFTDIKLHKYMLILAGSYILLFTGNLLMYYGVVSILSDAIPYYVSFPLLTLFVVYLYSGRQLFEKLGLKKVVN